MKQVFNLDGIIYSEQLAKMLAQNMEEAAEL